MNRINGNLRYYNVLESNFEANKIIDGVYLGSLESSYDKNSLKQKGITHIVSVLAGYVPPFPDDFNYFVINTLDTEQSDLIKVFDDCGAFISDAICENGNVLVHCAYGRSRSATIVASFLINSYGMDVDRVVNLLKSKRGIVEPNPHYMKQLNVYYRNKFSGDFL
jgi:protein-tyrosine phosphatase